MRPSPDLLPLPRILDPPTHPLRAILDPRSNTRDGISNRFARAARGSGDGMAETFTSRAHDAADGAAKPANRVPDGAGDEVDTTRRASRLVRGKSGHDGFF